jgi:hypothetical protein
MARFVWANLGLVQQSFVLLTNTNTNLRSSSVSSVSGGEPRILAVLPEHVDREDEHESVEAEHDQDWSVEIVLKEIEMMEILKRMNI